MQRLFLGSQDYHYNYDYIHSSERHYIIEKEVSVEVTFVIMKQGMNLSI